MSDSSYTNPLEFLVPSSLFSFLFLLIEDETLELVVLCSNRTSINGSLIHMRNLCCYDMNCKELSECSCTSVGWQKILATSFLTVDISRNKRNKEKAHCSLQDAVSSVNTIYHCHLVQYILCLELRPLICIFYFTNLFWHLFITYFLLL